MALDHLKTPQALSLNQWATRRVYEAIKSNGSAIPCKIVTPMGPLVEVNFEVSGVFTLPNLVVPVCGVSQYIRQPFQAGEGGVVFPSPVNLGGVTGIGGGAATLTDDLAPMSALTFFPVGNKAWSAADDPDKLVLYGPDGAILRTMDGSVKLDLSGSGVAVTGALETSGALKAGNGATGTFANSVTVLNGIVTGGS